MSGMQRYDVCQRFTDKIHRQRKRRRDYPMEWISKNCENFDAHLWQIIPQSNDNQVGKKAAISLPEHKNHEPMDVVEMDELYTYVKKRAKNTGLDSGR